MIETGNLVLVEWRDPQEVSRASRCPSRALSERSMT